MTESALRKAMAHVVKEYPGTYDPNVMEELRKPVPGKREKGYESVHQVAFPFHRLAKLFSVEFCVEVEGLSRCEFDVTPKDSTDYYARLYPLMGPTNGGGWTEDGWRSVLECFDEVRTKSFILLIVAVLSPPEIWKSDGGCWECHS